MCGIVGGIKDSGVITDVLHGLSRLEYRGYDSAGIAIINSSGVLQRKRSTNRVDSLVELCNDDNNFIGSIAMGHTRWATHGGVTTENAHPHFSNNTIAIVHNGIIENYIDIKHELLDLGYSFCSQTDTEVMAHLIYHLYLDTKNLSQAVLLAVKRLHGAYAIGVMCVDKPDELVCARFGSPLVLGVGDDFMFFASDIAPLLPVTKKAIYLEDGDVAEIKKGQYLIWDINDNHVERKITISNLSFSSSALGQFKHYMQKEIFEQPSSLADTILEFGQELNPKVFGDNAHHVFKSLTDVQIIACGTSLNAGLVAKYWIEEFAKVRVNVDIASEYRYRSVVSNPNTLIINISQSGETADTIASIKYAISLGMHNILSICNVAESSLSRLSSLHFLTHAGLEIGVASTKAFTAQLVGLLYFAFTLAKVRGCLTEDEATIISQLRHLPSLALQVLNIEDQIIKLSGDMALYDHALFLGRNYLYPIAIEGALKLKEISYIHAESYACGELKHGPLALIDHKMPSIILAPHEVLFSKNQSNIQEILARNGVVYLITDTDVLFENCKMVIKMPSLECATYLLPILYTIPLQLLSYHTAVIRGTDVDKPRNLAKSVTVE